MLNRKQLLLERKGGKAFPLLSKTPLTTSEGSDWRGVLLEHHETAAFEANDVYFQNDTVFVHLGEPVTLDWKDEKNSFTKELTPGTITVIPRWIRHSARCSTSSSFLMLSLTREFLMDSIADWGQSSELELNQTLSHEDSLVRELCFALQAELESGSPGGRVYGESLSASLAVHLIKNYSSTKPEPTASTGGLAKYKLRQVINYIHEHVAEDFALQTLADIANLSPFHFTRMFKKSTGLPPRQYLIRCRVQRARQLLLSSTDSLSSIASQSGFCDQSHFTAHFKRFYGITPKAFVQNEIKNKPAE